VFNYVVQITFLGGDLYCWLMFNSECSWRQCWESCCSAVSASEWVCHGWQHVVVTPWHWEWSVHLMSLSLLSVLNCIWLI